jgi:hypothetical protein
VGAIPELCPGFSDGLVLEGDPEVLSSVGWLDGCPFDDGLLSSVTAAAV